MSGISKSIFCYLILFVPIICFGQKKFADEFVVSEDFYEASQKTYLEELSQAINFTTLSKAKQKEKYEQLRVNTKMFIKRGSNGLENMVINKTAKGPSWKLLDYFVANFERLSKIMPPDTKAYQIDNGIKTFKNYTYLFFKNLVVVNNYERYSTSYVITVNNVNYMIVSNTSEELSFSDLIVSINP